jgi:hypothetical protein
VLGDLVNQSLVHAEEEPSGTRYRLLETLRAYAAERLAARGESEAVQRRHAEYYLALAEAADLGLRGPEQAQWAARLAREQDNIQAALRWTTEHGEAELAHRLVGALWWYWYTRPRGVEGTHWYDRVLALGTEAVPAAVRAKALTGAASQAILGANVALAQQHSQAALALHRTLDDGPEHGQALIMAGMLAAIGGESGATRQLFEESLALYRRIGGRRGEGFALGMLGQVATFAGNLDRASALLAASAEIFHEIGDPFGLAATLVRAGDTACCGGDLQAARAFYEESLAQFRAAGLPLGPPTLLHNLACVLRGQGESGRATALFREGLELYRDRGDGAGVALCLLGLAELALDARAPGLAARLLGAARSLPHGRPLGLLGGWVWTGERRAYEQQIAVARDALGAGAFEAAFAEGQVLTLDQALAEASALTEAGAKLISLRQYLA